MSDFSNYSENAVGNALFRNTTYTSVATVYVALFTAVTDAEAGTGTEVSTSGTAYARTAVTFGAPSNGVCTNSGAVSFATATGSGFGTVTHFGIFDASTAGNALTVIKALAASKTVAAGDTLSFAISAISFTIA